MAWIVLIVAALIDAAMAVALKYTDGDGRVFGRACRSFARKAAIYLLTRPLKGLPVGAAFAVFNVTGAIGISMTEILALSGECRTALEHGADLTGIVALKLLKT